MPGDVAGPRVGTAGVIAVECVAWGYEDRMITEGMSASPGSGRGLLFVCGIGVCRLVKMNLRIYERGKRRIKAQGKPEKA